MTLRAVESLSMSTQERKIMKRLSSSLIPLLAELGQGVSSLTARQVIEAEGEDSEWARMLTAVLMLHGDIQHREGKLRERSLDQIIRLRAVAVDSWLTAARTRPYLPVEASNQGPSGDAMHCSMIDEQLEQQRDRLEITWGDVVDHYRRNTSPGLVEILATRDLPLPRLDFVMLAELLDYLDGMVRTVANLVAAAPPGEGRPRLWLAWHDADTADEVTETHEPERGSRGHRVRFEMEFGARLSGDGVLRALRQVVRGLGGHEVPPVGAWQAGSVELEGPRVSVELRDAPGRVPAVRVAAQQVPHISDHPLDIVVVDDERIIGTVIRRTVEGRLGLPCRVKQFTSAVDALHHIEEMGPDLIISDISMPEMTGAELYTRSVQTSPELASRFLFVSGSVMPPELRGPHDRGEVGYLEKPFRPAELLQCVRQFWRDA